MNFYQAFDSIKESIKNFDSSKFSGDFAIQLTMTNKDCGGIFYIEYKNGTLNVEPYNYYDHNVDVTASYNDLCKALSGALNLKIAAEKGKIAFSGDSGIFEAFVSAISFVPAEKKAPKKTAPKKTTAKKTAKETAKKPAKETAKAVTEKAVKTAKETAEKVEQTVKSAAEKAEKTVQETAKKAKETIKATAEKSKATAKKGQKK